MTIMTTMRTNVPRTAVTTAATLALTLGPATLACSPAMDLDGDGTVEVDDLLAVIAAWGMPQSQADFDGDGYVDVDDLVELLACWGQTVPTSPSVALGTNFGEHVPWGAIPFNDVMKQSWDQWFSTDAVFGGGEFNTGYADEMTGPSGWPAVDIPYDPDGPGPVPPQVLHTITMRDLYWGAGGPFPPADTLDAERYPAGEYLVTFDGTGAIEMYGSDTDTQTYSGPGPHHFPVANPNNSGIGVKIIQSSAVDPIRNIQIRMPGYAFDDDENPAGPFTTEFVETLKDFAVMRFMGWVRANGHSCYNGVADAGQASCEQTWTDRSTPAYRTQTTSRGVALEYMIELANISGVDPWFVIPHAATDEYIEQMALLVAETLDPQRTIYLEYSNEVWNPIYDAYHFANQMGAGLADFPVPAWNVRRSQEIFCTFKEVGGFDDDRLVTIVSTQFNNPWLGNLLMGYWNDPEINPNPCGVVLDRLGVGPYFADDDEHAASPEDSIDDLVNKILKSIHQGRYHTRSVEYQQIAEQWGVELIAYEGGHHLVEPNNNSPVQDLYAELTRDERIKDVYFEAYAEWASITNNALYTYASTVERYSQTSFFGHKEYAAQQLYVIDADGLRPYKMEAVHEIALGLGP